MRRSDLALVLSTPTISLPVESPRACSTRLVLWAASRVNARRPPSRSNAAPQSISSRM